MQQGMQCIKECCYVSNVYAYWWLYAVVMSDRLHLSFNIWLLGVGNIVDDLQFHGRYAETTLSLIQPDLIANKYRILWSRSLRYLHFAIVGPIVTCVHLKMIIYYN